MKGKKREREGGKKENRKKEKRRVSWILPYYPP
jgi:hypothetical protein